MLEDLIVKYFFRLFFIKDNKIFNKNNQFTTYVACKYYLAQALGVDVGEIDTTLSFLKGSFNDSTKGIDTVNSFFKTDFPDEYRMVKRNAEILGDELGIDLGFIVNLDDLEEFMLNNFNMILSIQMYHPQTFLPIRRWIKRNEKFN